MLPGGVLKWYSVTIYDRHIAKSLKMNVKSLEKV
jgi:hypothetical protein